jgi:sugar/nucleoside kinase (ribokinase family)
LASGWQESSMSRESFFGVTGRPTVVGTGLVALDVVVSDERPGDKRTYAGGTCGNVLSILAYLGWQAYPVSRLKSDAAGKRVVQDFGRWGVQLDFLRSRPVVDTPIINHKIYRGPAGEPRHRFTFTCLDCGSWLPGYRPIVRATAVEVAAKLQTPPQVYFMDRVSPGAIALAKLCAARGAIIVFEPSGMGEPRLFRQALALTHILKYSNERMNELSGLPKADGPLVQIETMGPEGLRYRTNLPGRGATDWTVAPARAARAVTDTAGAGDWCTAGIIHALGQQGLGGLVSEGTGTLGRAMDFGQALAAWNCEFEGARGGMYRVAKKVFELEVSHLLGGAHAAHARDPNSAIKQAPVRCLGPACAGSASDGAKRGVAGAHRGRSGAGGSPVRPHDARPKPRPKKKVL